MSQWGYYSPAILGALGAMIYAVFGRGDYAQSDRAIIAAIAVPSAAIACQLLLFVAQGVFAGVLPVPRGRTLRGPKCVVIGLFILGAMALGAMAYLASRTSTGVLFLGCAIGGAACALAAITVYGWSLPTAKPDFTDVEAA